jgi:hypothetical protein
MNHVFSSYRDGAEVDGRFVCISSSSTGYILMINQTKLNDHNHYHPGSQLTMNKLRGSGSGRAHCARTSALIETVVQQPLVLVVDLREGVGRLAQDLGEADCLWVSGFV